jgi:hypothetical protein
MPKILPLDAATYTRHALHRGDRAWTETNCYTDVIIELLHGMGFEPLAAMAFTLSIDFDVDQWTFFKFHPADLEELYAVGLHELAPWRPLVVHVEENVAAGRPVVVELDSFFLPDTAGAAYKLAHVKSTVAVNEIDVEQRRLGYFHNQSYHHLSGQDFSDIFQTEGLVHARMLPPYIEFVKAVPRARALTGAERRDASVAQLRRNLRRLPPSDPFVGFKARLEEDMSWLLEGDLEVFHGYSFATLRQYGACYALAAAYLRWLESEGVDGLETSAVALDTISETTKVLQFQLARAVMRKRPPKLGALDDQAALWEQAMGALSRRFG